MYTNAACNRLLIQEGTHRIQEIDREEFNNGTNPARRVEEVGQPGVYGLALPYVSPSHVAHREKILPKRDFVVRDHPRELGPPAGVCPQIAEFAGRKTGGLYFSHDPQHHLYLSEKGGKGARTIHLFELCRSTGRCARDRGKNDPNGKCGSSGQSMGRSAGRYAVSIVRLLLTGL